MSENAITLVELDVTREDAENRAHEIADWLLAKGIVVPNPTPGLTQPSAFLPGSRAVTAAPDAAHFLGLRNNGVDLVTERELHHPVENYEPPPCPACGTTLDEDTHFSFIEDWVAGDEPTVTCEHCGTPNRLGDWVGEFTFYVGNLAARFNNWTPLSDEFTTDLGARLGARWRVVLRHS